MKTLFFYLLAILFVLLGSCNKNEFEEVNVGVFIPSAFSPNNDGNNEIFMPIVSNSTNTLKDYKMIIYSMNGTELFQSTYISMGWNGKQDVNGQAYPNGTYIYNLWFKFYDGYETNRIGMFELIKDK